MQAALLIVVLFLSGGCGRDAPEHGHPRGHDGTDFDSRDGHASADIRRAASGSASRHSGGCTLDFSYAIGTIDPRFRISRNEVRQTVGQALELWAGAVDHLHVQYHDGARAGEEARNTIHFIYDERQQQSDHARRFMDQITAKGDFIEQMQREYEREQQAFERRNNEHEQLIVRLNNKIERLNTWVEDVNRAGGFRQEKLGEYEERMAGIEALRERELRMRNELEQLMAAINRSADHINREAAFHNDMIRQFYRQFGDESRFSSGLYQFDGTRGTITIYHFHNRRELMVILAHEIGHALGLDHVPDSKSIMYHTLQDQMLGYEVELSSEDIRAIRALCK